MFGLLMTIIVGFIVGVIAKLIMPGKENMGFIVTTCSVLPVRLSRLMPVRRWAGMRQAKEPVGSVRSSAPFSCCGSTGNSRDEKRLFRVYRGRVFTANDLAENREISRKAAKAQRSDKRK